MDAAEPVTAITDPARGRQILGTFAPDAIKSARLTPHCPLERRREACRGINYPLDGYQPLVA
jgi:hypothetical protein